MFPLEFKDYIIDYGFCIVTNRIAEEGERIGFMYRERPVSGGDSGWRFFKGDELPEYIDDISNSAIFELNTIANLDSSIVRFLDAPIHSKFERDPDTLEFKPIKGFRWYLRSFFKRGFKVD